MKTKKTTKEKIADSYHAVAQHEDRFIHIPKDYAQVMGLLALYAISGWVMWNILFVAADHKAELDGISWFALLANSGFAIAYYGIWFGNWKLTIHLRGKNSGLPLLPLLPLLLPLLLLLRDD